MVEVIPNLFVGSQEDENIVRCEQGWFVIHACKEPYHRNALGYAGRAVSKDHPEYLIARREGRLILNLIDADNMAYIPSEIIDAAVQEIHDRLPEGKVLVHCNQGLSRSPSIALLYLRKHWPDFALLDHNEGIAQFRRLYPAYAPAGGMRDYVRRNW